MGFVRDGGSFPFDFTTILSYEERGCLQENISGLRGCQYKFGKLVMNRLSFSKTLFVYFIHVCFK
jgi:hypothetical protein